MSNLNYNIGQIPFRDEKWPCGIGYICIPSDVERGIFIYESIRTGTVMIRTEDGGVYRNCPVSKNVFDYIQWPERFQENGSPVFYITEPKHQQPVVLGILNYNDEIIDQNEHEFKFSREKLNSLVQIIGNAENEELTIFVQGDKRGNLFVRLANNDNKAELSFDIDGVYNLKTTKAISIHSQSNILQKVGERDEKSSVISQDPSQVNIRVEKFIINDGDEAIMLGNMWKDLMDAFIDEVSRSTVTTSLGQMPLLNAAQIASFRQKTEEVLSKYSFTK